MHALYMPHTEVYLTLEDSKVFLWANMRPPDHTHGFKDIDI